MKTLTLLRHAKSGWDDPLTRDFDRPLNRRGRRAARTVGEEMRVQGLRFDRVLASPALRVMETLEEVAQAYGPIEPDYDPRLYLASVETLIELIRATPESVDRLLLVGHNPGLERLALALSGGADSRLRGEIEVKYPTGTLAEIRLDVAGWRQVDEGCGAIVRFVRPRDLDPALGPDGT
jgi:phosphohistidine phosphatase